MNAREYRTLAPHIVSQDGAALSFREQVELFALGDMPSGDMLIVTVDGSELGLPEVGQMPVTMRQKTVRKIREEHEISLNELSLLPEWLKGHPLAMESITEPDSIVVVADAVDVYGNDIVIAIHLGLSYQGVEVDEVSSAYGKRSLAYLIENTYDLGKKIYPNQRTGDWILRSGLQLPEQIANRLCINYSTITTEPTGVFFDRAALDETAPADPAEAAEREAEELLSQLQRIDDAIDLSMPDCSLIAAVLSADGSCNRLDEAYISAFELTARGSVLSGMEIERITERGGDLVVTGIDAQGGRLSVSLRAATPEQVERFESIGDPDMPIPLARRVADEVWEGSSPIRLGAPRPELEVDEPLRKRGPRR